MEYLLGIVGAGQMAEAIVRGLLHAGAMKPEEIIASDVSSARRAVFAALGLRTTGDNTEALRARTVLLSVKPQHMHEVLAGIAPAMKPDRLVVSIAAGISTVLIEDGLGCGGAWRVIRAMPNTPMLVGKGVVALSRGRHATDEDMHTARGIFEPRAAVMEVPEDLMDAITAVSGSGPAYFFYLVEHMIEAGRKLGLSDAQASELVRRTAEGAAAMLVGTADSPAELRRRVTSPGGTTEAAVRVLEERGAGRAVVEAIAAAAARARHLGRSAQERRGTGHSSAG